MKGNVSIDRYLGHAADLDAHTRNIWQVRTIGRIYYPPQVGTRRGGANGNALDAANQLYAMPFPLEINRVADRLVVDITAQAGEKIRMGIYLDNGSLLPGVLLLDAGEITLSATGEIAYTISQALTKGTIWLAFVSNGTPTIRDYNTNCEPILGTEANCVFLAHTYGPLPNPFGAANYHHRAWGFGLRFSS